MPGPGTIRSPLPETNRLHRVGVIRAGVRKVTQKESGPVEYPSATDHFVVNADPSTSQQSADSFHEVFGTDPKQIPIVLVGDTPEDNLFSIWQLYGGSKAASQLNRKCQGPGGRSSVRSADGTAWVDGPCQCQAEGLQPGDTKKKGAKGDHCTPRWTLSFLLMDVTGLGVWQFGTNSPWSGENLASTLKTLHGMLGSLLQQECILRLVPRSASPEGRPKTIYIAELEPMGISPRQAMEMRQAAIEAPKLGSLPPVIEDGDPMLDGAAGQYDFVAQLGETPPALTSAAVDAEPVPDVTLSVGQQLRRLEEGDRKRLYEMVGIKRGMSPADVEGLLWAKWGELELMDVQAMDVGYLYAELLKAHGDTDE